MRAALHEPQLRALTLSLYAVGRRLGGDSQPLGLVHAARLGRGQLYRLGVEFRIIQKRQLAEPAKATAAPEKARKPTRHSDGHQAVLRQK
jgi:hypothetical protein